MGGHQLKMGNRIPLVSVVIPVRNGMPFIRKCVSSAAEQTWSSTEVIVVDDGSTDGSSECVQDCGYRNIKLIQGTGSGACAARNAGLAASSGEFVQFLDADDLLGPNKIELQVQQLLGALSSESCVSYSRLTQFRDGSDPEAGITWHDVHRSMDRPVDLLIEILDSGRFIQTGQWLIPRSLAISAGPWDENLCADQDGDYFSRVLVRATACVACPDAVAYYRRMNTGLQISAGKTQDHFESRMQALDRKLSLVRGIADEQQMRKIISRQCGQLAFSSYPCNVPVTRRCLAMLKAHGVEFVPEFPTLRLRLISKFLGWRVARYCSYLKHGGLG